MDKQTLLDDLRHNIYCRIQASPVAGVGVFAIKAIPQETNPFLELREVDVVEVPESEIFDDPDIDPMVKRMVRDLYMVRDGNVYMPTHSLNEINIGYFVNHSKTPNMKAVDQNGYVEFITARDIAVGEELTIDYSTYTHDWKTVVPA